MILGYKCFNKDLTNRYGIKFEVGKTYNANGEIKFGTTDYRTHRHGLHMCKNIEDTFRLFDTFNEEVCICEVRGMGKNVLITMNIMAIMICIQLKY